MNQNTWFTKFLFCFFLNYILTQFNVLNGYKNGGKALQRFNKGNAIKQMGLTNFLQQSQAEPCPSPKNYVMDVIMGAAFDTSIDPPAEGFIFSCMLNTISLVNRNSTVSADNELKYRGTVYLSSGQSTSKAKNAKKLFSFTPKQNKTANDMSLAIDNYGISDSAKFQKPSIVGLLKSMVTTKISEQKKTKYYKFLYTFIIHDDDCSTDDLQVIQQLVWEIQKKNPLSEFSAIVDSKLMNGSKPGKSCDETIASLLGCEDINECDPLFVADFSTASSFDLSQELLNYICVRDRHDYEDFMYGKYLIQHQKKKDKKKGKKNGKKNKGGKKKNKKQNKEQRQDVVYHEEVLPVPPDTDYDVDESAPYYPDMEINGAEDETTVADSTDLDFTDQPIQIDDPLSEEKLGKEAEGSTELDSTIPTIQIDDPLSEETLGKEAEGSTELDSTDQPIQIDNPYSEEMMGKKKKNKKKKFKLSNFHVHSCSDKEAKGILKFFMNLFCSLNKKISKQ